MRASEAVGRAFDRVCDVGMASARVLMVVSLAIVAGLMLMLGRAPGPHMVALPRGQFSAFGAAFALVTARLFWLETRPESRARRLAGGRDA